MQEYSGQHQKTPVHRRTSIHQAETKELLESVAKKTYERNDHWGECVKIRIQCIGDLIAAEAVYHHECQVRFHACKSAPEHGYSKGRPKGCVDSEKGGAFSKLCEHIDTCDEYQFSLRQLEDLLASFQSSKEAGYSSKHFKNKLCEQYGKDMIITSQLGKETIYTFLDAGNSILRASYEDSGLSKESIVDMAAMIIEDDIRSANYDVSFSDLENRDLIPQSLQRLLDRIVKTKSLVSERRRIGLAHSIISAARPRSFISPILLAIAVYVNARHESRELIDILSALGFCDDYREVQRLYDAMLPNEQQVYDLSGDLVNFVFDNADVNIRTLTGLGTWHAMGGIACVTPVGAEHTETEIPRSTRIRSAAQIGEFAQIPIRKYRKSQVAGLKKCVFGSLDTPQPDVLQLAISLDNLWLASFSLCMPVGAVCPSWSGFMHSYRRESQQESY